jgi:hypothetical protein
VDFGLGAVWLQDVCAPPWVVMMMHDGFAVLCILLKGACGAVLLTREWCRSALAGRLRAWPRINTMLYSIYSCYEFISVGTIGFLRPLQQPRNVDCCGARWVHVLWRGVVAAFVSSACWGQIIVMDSCLPLDIDFIMPGVGGLARDVNSMAVSQLAVCQMGGVVCA